MQDEQEVNNSRPAEDNQDLMDDRREGLLRDSADRGSDNPSMSPSRSKRMVAGIAISVLSLVLVVLVGFNIYTRVQYAGFFDEATFEFPLPGVHSGFIPQDLDHVDQDDIWLISGYMSDGSPSPLYRRYTNSESSKVYLALPDGSAYDGHGSAVTTDKDITLVACDEGYLVFSTSDIVTAKADSSVEAKAQVDLNFTPAFMNIENNRLYLGNFYYPDAYETPEEHHVTTPDGTDNPAVMYEFAKDSSQPSGFSIKADKAYSIPAKVQGMCITDEGLMVLSTSYGFSASHLLAYDMNLMQQDGELPANLADEEDPDVPLICLDGRSLVQDIAAPPMTEGIEDYQGIVFISEESATNKYIFGKLSGGGYVMGLYIGR